MVFHCHSWMNGLKTYRFLVNSTYKKHLGTLYNFGSERTRAKYGWDIMIKGLIESEISNIQKIYSGICLLKKEHKLSEFYNSQIRRAVQFYLY